MSSAALEGKIMPTGLKQTKPRGLNYANVRHVDAVTELKAGPLTRRLSSSVFCEREELQLVLTLTFSTLKIFYIHNNI